MIEDKEYDLTPNIRNFLSITKLTYKSFNNNDKITVYNNPKDTGFYDKNFLKD